MKLPAIDAWSGLSLTSPSPEPEFTLFFGAENLVYLVFGMAVLGIAAALPGLETAEDNRAQA